MWKIVYGIISIMATLILFSMGFNFAWIKYIGIFILIISLIYSSYKIKCKEYTQFKGVNSKFLYYHL